MFELIILAQCTSVISVPFGFCGRFQSTELEQLHFDRLDGVPDVD